MRAAVAQRYGGPEVVRLVDVPQPEPSRGEVLVRMRSAAVTSGDARIRAARFPRGFALPARLVLGFTGPRRPILGSTLAGVVEGAEEDFAPGDAVCGMTGMRFGTHAEFVAVPTSRLARIPIGVSFEDAAGVLFGGTTALYFLRDKAKVAVGMSVLVIGASGAVGSNAVQLAKHFGATVTGVTSTRNVERVTELGAAKVIDYTHEPLELLRGRFDVVFDTVGALNISTGQRLLNDGGRLLLAVATLADELRARGNVVAGTAPERVADFEFLLQLAARGELKVVHDATFALSDIVAAHRRVDTGHKVGNVIVKPE
jgi:NADPH:quinone reductase-like Zn-dependent oxidoreductase